MVLQKKRGFSIEKRARSFKFVLEERGLVVVVFRKSDPPRFFFLLWLQP
jgi:hypothetical protein